MIRQVYEIDANGYIAETHIAEFDEKDNPVDELPENYITADPPQGLYRAKWTGTEWVEDMPPEEIAELNSGPRTPTPEERINDIENAILILLGM